VNPLRSPRARSLLLGVVVSVAAAALLLATTDIGQVAAAIGRAQPIWLLPSLLILAGQAWLRAVRWATLLRPWAGPAIRARRVAGAMLVGYFVNAVMPARLGEVARAAIVSARESIAIGGVAASVVGERAVDILALFALAAVALAVAGSTWAAAFAVAAIGLTVVVALASRATMLQRFVPARLPARLAGGIRGFLDALAAIPRRPSATAVVLSAMAWLGDAGIVLLVARALGLDVPPAGALLLALGGALGTALPAAPGYIATYELGALALATLAGVPRETALPVALVTHVIGVTVLAVAGAIALGPVTSLVRLDLPSLGKPKPVRPIAGAAGAQTLGDR
jgi:uncharacterized protein (TIRG00374 family)